MSRFEKVWDKSDLRVRAERRRDLLLAELYELEDEGYRRALAHAERMTAASIPAPALRAAIGHANASLDELRGIVLSRKVKTRSLRALVFDALRDLVDRLESGAEEGAEGRLAILGLDRPANVVRMVRAAAHDMGDDSLVRWCDGWLRARLPLTRAAVSELESRLERARREARRSRHVRLAPAA